MAVRRFTSGRAPRRYVASTGTCDDCDECAPAWTARRPITASGSAVVVRGTSAAGPDLRIASVRSVTASAISRAVSDPVES